MCSVSLQFKAAASEGDMQLIIKRSRFIASIRRMNSPSALQPLLKAVAVENPKANHHCWAYRFGIEQVEEHCSDDGEPSGTAGRPILGALKRSELHNTLIVVTRYFGGVKLGVRGLIEAYEAVAQLVIEEVGFEIVELEDVLLFRMPYDAYSLFVARLARLGVEEERLTSHFDGCVWGSALIPRSKRSSLIAYYEEFRARGGVELKWQSEDVSESE